jgi:hypothetical protein
VGGRLIEVRDKLCTLFWQGAETNPACFANQDGSLEVIYGGGGVALYATIVDAHNPTEATAICHYHFGGCDECACAFLRSRHHGDWASPSAPVTVIFQQLGGTYSVNVACDGTGKLSRLLPCR